MPAPRDRRALLKTGARMGAVAGGLVWARPAIHTVKLVAASGTAPPETTTSPTTSPQSTHIDFTGPLSSNGGGPNAAPDCPGFILNVYGTADLSVLGHTDVYLAPCFEFPEGPDGYHPAGDGHFVLTPLGGTITGTVAGTLLQEGSSAPPLTINWTLHITGGTGTFAGAVGTATYIGQLWEIGVSSGTLAGSFDLPSA